MRGRVQVEWNGANQTRANNSRDWLALQLAGRGYEAQVSPLARLKRGVWTTQANILFTTTSEAEIVKTLVAARMSADPFILSGSWMQIHECPHDEGLNNCASTLVRTTK